MAHLCRPSCFADLGRIEMTDGTDQRPLYERLGGVYNIATVVDDFIDRIRLIPA